ncbi:hypothetical protein GCM10010317_038340 [Streptomyces mirabilis]|nr:hypothetical protein GCM10010317_038340 [Streptomyces mirabilis]
MALGFGRRGDRGPGEDGPRGGERRHGGRRREDAGTAKKWFVVTSHISPRNGDVRDKSSRGYWKIVESPSIASQSPRKADMCRYVPLRTLVFRPKVPSPTVG